MLERRQDTRRRVCWQGSVTAGIEDPILPVHIRNISDTGAQVRVEQGALPAQDLMLRVDRTGTIRQATVIWRAMETYGLRFLSDRTMEPEPLRDWIGRKDDMAVGGR